MRSRLLFAIARRQWLVSRVFLGLGVVLAAFYWWQLTQTGGSPVDEARPALEGLRSSGGQAGRLTRSILARAATGIG